MQILHQSANTTGACSTGNLPNLHQMQRQVTSFFYLCTAPNYIIHRLLHHHHLINILEHRPPTQVVPPQHAASGPQAQPLCNFKYKTRQGKNRTRSTNFVVCERTAAECFYHRKPPEPPPVPLPASSHELRLLRLQPDGVLLPLIQPPPEAPLPPVPAPAPLYLITTASTLF